MSDGAVLIADKWGTVRGSSGGYASANRHSPDMACWLPGGGSADFDILPDLALTTGRARDLEFSNGLAAGAPQTVVDNVVGPTLRLNAQPDWRALGKSQKWARDWAREVEARWMPYSESLYFDSEEQVNFSIMAGIVVRGRWSNGGHLVLPQFRERPGVRYATCFQGIEIDRLSDPQDRHYDRTKVRGGIEFDRFGAPDGYYIANAHPGDWYGLPTPITGWTRVPAKTAWGRRRVLHCFHKTRSGQSRGVSALAPVMREFKALARYRQAELNRAVAHALTTYFIRTQMPNEWIVEMFGSPENYLSERRDLTERARSVMAQASFDRNTIVPMNPGDEIVDPRRDSPNAQMETFETAILRDIAAGLNISYETLRRDYSKSNYSSARAAMLQDWKTFLGMRKWLATYYASPIYTLWMEEAVNRGDIEAPDFYENIEAYTACRWTGAGRGWVDPAKEAQASVTRLSHGISTLETEAAEQGGDWETNVDQRLDEFTYAMDGARKRELPEAAAWVAAGMPIPQHEIMTTPISPTFSGRPSGQSDPGQSEPPAPADSSDTLTEDEQDDADETGDTDQETDDE